MPKLTSHEDDVLVYELLRHWTRDGHEVALMRLTNKQVPESAAAYLMCECDFDLEDVVEDGKVVAQLQRSDSYACAAKKEVRAAVIRRSRKRGFGHWQTMGLKEAILDIYRRVKEDEFFGQSDGGVIYTQQVAELLGRPHEDILAACGELYAEERLDLNGRILADYVPCFRFPADMQAIMRYVVEEPLGWPNGEAGEGWVAGFEREVGERLGFTSGKQAFGTHWPTIDAVILAEYALEPVAAKLRQVAPLVPDRPMSPKRMATLLIDAMGDAAIGESLRKLEASCPEIAAAAFGEFIRALFLLSLERVEIDQAMRTVKVPPEQTLCEMAEFFEKVAANSRVARS